MSTLDSLLERLNDVAQLADTIPPVEPPAVLPYAPPTPHRVIAWRHDNGLQDSKHDSLETARAYAQSLHYAVYWKYAIMAGREMVERKFIEEDSQ